MDFDFDEFMRKAKSNETEERFRDCLESTGRHSDPDPQGRCHWCRKKIAPRAMRPRPPVGHQAEIDIAYDYFYNPDGIE